MTQARKWVPLKAAAEAIQRTFKPCATATGANGKANRVRVGLMARVEGRESLERQGLKPHRTNPRDMEVIIAISANYQTYVELVRHARQDANNAGSRKIRNGS